MAASVDCQHEMRETMNFETGFEYPEGGFRAWLVVLGAWCAMMPSMGLLNTIGIIEAWLAENQLAPLPKSQIAWIVSLYSFFLYLGGSCVGAIFDRYGLRPVVLPGSVGMVASMMCLSVSTNYYQFLLSFGVLGGISACCLFTPSVSTIGHWFCKRQGVATGIACTAGGMGRVLFSCITLYLAPAIGFPWTMRVIGFVCMAFCITASVTLQTRDVHAYCAEDVQKPGFLQCLREAFTLRLLASDRSYFATTIAVFLIEFAVFIPFTYLSSAAINTGSGLSPDKAYRLIVFLNVGSVPGRALPGYVADRMGRFNVMIMTAVVCMILIFCIWMPLTALREANESALTAFAVLFGFWCGAAISLTPVCIAQVSKIEEVGKRVGTTFSIASIGALVGVPIGGAIIDSNNGDYLGLVIFAGGLYTVAMAAFVISRCVSGPRQICAIY